jgi:Uma2 family endonuclease
MPPSKSERQPFYGWRYRKVIRPDGTEDLEESLLTLEDVLHPQEGDVIPEAPIQERDRRYLTSVFETRLPRFRKGLVLSDCIVNWGVRGIRNHSPDVSVFEGLRKEPDRPFGTFRVAVWGGRCLLAIEIVSPSTRVNDVWWKFRHYHRVGVPLYLIVDQEWEEGPRHLLAYRRTARKYVEMPRDDQGRVLLKHLGLLLGMLDNRVACYDADTGAEIGDYVKVAQERDAAVAAQKVAERRARHEAKQAQREAQARQAAEQRSRELEAELRRLRGQGPA